ncbi:hypothetical protein EOD41_10715 [Mucilaginibacter limnophilus]|uniref:Uncharacterized protein n=1 Tax=Mucilaginibacter limnophilus TaxID=1932778 RepID=A0A3S2ULE2_9SPHI|nr:hypothetical protein [Mucilaginibacter limnophilus]RVU01078.1 hypothetical protein EOD41_10715 [Mucilaginibacter limnophilus]
MGVSLTKAPPRVAFSRNPNPIELYSDDILDNAGATATCIIKFNGTVLPAADLKLTWAGADLTFKAAISPNTSGLQYPSGDGSEAHVRSVITWLQSNYYINRDFNLAYTFYSAAHSISVVAKQKGKIFNMSPWTAGNLAVIIGNTGIDIAYKPNFNHFLEVWKVGALKPLFDRALSLDIPVTGKTIKDLSGVLNPHLKYDKPDLTSVWQVCSTSVLRYYLKYMQYYGETPEFKAIAITEEYLVCLGGYSKQALSQITNTDHLENYLLPGPTLYKVQRWFESYPVDNIEVNTNQPQFLYFLNMRNVAEQLDIRVQVFLSDGTTDIKIIAGGTVQPLEKVSVSTGYQQLGLQAYTTSLRNITRYEVQLIERTSGDSRTVAKTYIVNRDYQDYTRYILYGDSAGNFKTLRANGKSIPKTEITDSEAQAIESLETPTDGNFIRYDVKMVESDTLQSGYIAGDVNCLKELVISREAYRVFGNTLIPIKITSKNFDPKQDAVNLKAAKIEYRLAFDEENYTGSTGALIVPDLSRPTNPINDI